LEANLFAFLCVSALFMLPNVFLSLVDGGIKGIFMLFLCVAGGATTTTTTMMAASTKKRWPELC